MQRYGDWGALIQVSYWMLSRIVKQSLTGAVTIDLLLLAPLC